MNQEKENRQGIVYIGIEHIHPHPENPRKNLGDLTELAESLKKNGVMQNLTVVPIDGQPGEYYALIGNRRHGASKLAGLTELPCRIVEGMSQKEQLSTMLEENMQRNDLTIYEQAQGFQMMLDLGETEESIAEKTGFSKTTIRHRLNIAKLDQQELQKKEQSDSFQLTLKDLYELEKVEDIKTRNKILKEATSSRDLIWKAQSAAAEAKRKKTAMAVIKKLSAMGIEEAPKKAESEMYSGKWDTVKDIGLDDEVPETIKYKAKKTDKLYYLEYCRSVRIIKKAEKKPESPQEKEHKERNKKKQQIKAKIREMDARRKEFIQNIISGKIQAVKNTAEVQEEIWNALVDLGVYLSPSSMMRFFTGKPDYDCTPEEKKEAVEKIEKLTVLYQMLTVLHYGMENVGDIYDWLCCYNEEHGQKLLKAYAILKRYGWSFEGDEGQLLDGTHELYDGK